MKKTPLGTITMVLVFMSSFLLTSSVTAGVQTKTYLVNSNANDHDNNPGDGNCATSGGECTLVAAVEEANADGDTSTIHFAQKFQTESSFDGCSIPVLTAENTTIDASSQWDTDNNRPGVEISGAGCDLLTIQAHNTTILGILFGGSHTVGIKSLGNFNIIGGYNPGQRNVFVSGDVEIDVKGNSNAISNNYFGTIDGDTTIAGLSGNMGIFVDVGAYTSIADNLIVGQTDYGIFVSTSNNTIHDNIIGMSWNQSQPLANGIGIWIDWSPDNTIGPYNVIAGNISHGVYLNHANHTNITRNYIGSFWGTGNGGDGIHIHISSNTHITDYNFIAYNTLNGIYADTSSDTTIQGNGLSANKQAGIYFFDNSDSQIGGEAETKRNSIGDNESHGIWLESSDTITVTGNYIGLSQGAFDAGNLGYGILVDNGSTDITIGGTNPGEPNWIGWNHMDGIRLDGSSTHHNYILGNVIGAPINWGWEAANGLHGVGIYNGAHDNYIGWDGLPNGGNTIISSGWTGLAIVNSSNNAVLANRIGTNGAGINWGNAYYGIDIVNSSGNSVKGNQIAYNGTHGGMDNAQAGVHIDGIVSINNMVSGNSIHDNDGPGIKLTNEANHNLAAPVITDASCEQVQGTACANCLIEIYSDNDDEGRRYEGHFTTTPSGSFNWNGALFGPNTTALAIGPGSSNDTSPFSAPFNVGPCINYKIYLPISKK
jgi:parallel beta-helix repeat protein